MDEFVVHFHRIDKRRIPAAPAYDIREPYREQLRSGNDPLLELKPQGFVERLNVVIDIFRLRKPVRLDHHFESNMLRCMKVEQCHIQIEKKVLHTL